MKKSGLWMLVVLGLSGCTPTMTAELLDGFGRSFGETVTVSDSDTSAPTVTLSIPDLGNGMGAVVLHPGDAPLTIHVGGLNMNGFFIVATAEDPQGVKSICISSGFRRECSSGGVTQLSQPLSYDNCDESQATVGGTATTKRWLPRYVDLAVVSACPPGQDGGTTLGFSATGTNFSGQTQSTPSVKFVNP